MGKNNTKENFVAYNSERLWGTYENLAGKMEFKHYSGHARTKLEKTFGQNVWVISGTKVGQHTIYKLCAVFQPNRLRKLPNGGHYVIGDGKGFASQIELNGFSWMADLIKEQGSFRFGLNKISNQLIVKGLQRAAQTKPSEFRLPDELPNDSAKIYEGAVRKVTVNAYERKEAARLACIRHFGINCFFCGFNFESVYGYLGNDYIHVHHLIPLSSIKRNYQVDPKKDLRPICPNCHAMIHKKNPPFTEKEFKALLKSKARR